MDEQLERAYRATDYCLWLAAAQHILHIDEPAPAVMQVLREKLGLLGKAFIVTPCNPYSQALDDGINRQRLLEFRDHLNSDDIRWMPAVNRDPEQLWPDEPGALLFDCSPAYAAKLGRKFEQNALVEFGLDAIPRLITL